MLVSGSFSPQARHEVAANRLQNIPVFSPLWKTVLDPAWSVYQGTLTLVAFTLCQVSSC